MPDELFGWWSSEYLIGRQNLLGEHVELHGLGVVIVNDEDGWRHHPERKRWEDHLPALKARHDIIAAEMVRRGYQHNTPFPDSPEFEGEIIFPPPWQPERIMRRVLKAKRREQLRRGER